ncbi:unnamed protein product, partial [Mesorhabditis belari]|uniref:tRNA-dihydrouridine(47) synthase [NAD(P)(+)] n=1 Tax=Mesorhabditis belari TaxID=2138241 RepID=A0AAF3FF22_9BILA
MENFRHQIEKAVEEDATAEEKVNKMAKLFDDALLEGLLHVAADAQSKLVDDQKVVVAAMKATAKAHKNKAKLFGKLIKEQRQEAARPTQKPHDGKTRGYAENVKPHGFYGHTHLTALTQESATMMSDSKAQPQETTKSKKTKAKPKNENKRISFLHKAAFMVSIQGSSTNDAFAKISRSYARVSKEVSNKESLKIAPNFARCFCRKCRHVFATAEGIEKMKVNVDANCLVRMTDGTTEEGEAIPDSQVKSEDATISSQMAGVALIKHEFLIHDEMPIEVKSESQVRNPDKNKRRGINKNRLKEMAQMTTKVRASSVRLCPSAFMPGIKCKHGTKCTSEHDIATFLKGKEPDLGETCPLYDQRGYCPFSYACRFGNAHLTEDGQQRKETLNSPYVETVNNRSMHIQMAMRKRKYDFGRSLKFLETLPDCYHQRKGARNSAPNAKDFSVDVAKKGGVAETIDEHEDQEDASILKGTTNMIGSMERERRIMSAKELNEKLYVAPLTTVGNLPFRRLCVEMGAEITCSEMALATSILAGVPSEFSLIKRHPSERIFGVQLAGGFADTMTMATQIIVDEFEVDFIDINMGCPIDVVNQKGGGCALPTRPTKLYDVMRGMRSVMNDMVLTMKMRTGMKEGVLTAHETLTGLVDAGCKPDLVTFHPRSKEQRYSKLAKWEFVTQCKSAVPDIPFWVCGDVLGWEDYYERREHYSIDGIMIGRGALIKPWLLTEIKERRHWDIAATERLDLVKKFVWFGLDHWGSDSTGIEKTRRFLLEWLSFACRYIPVGLLEVLPQRINDRPPYYKMNYVNDADRLSNGQHNHLNGIIPDAAEADPPMAPFVEHQGDIRVLSQQVHIMDFDFESRSFRVHTDLVIVPFNTELTRIHLNLGRAALLPNEADFDGKIAVNGEEATYTRIEPIGDLNSSCPSLCLSDLSDSFYERYRENQGELKIDLPIDLLPLVRQARCFLVAIDVLVRAPKFGVQFNSKHGNIHAERGAHAFTYRTSAITGTREWLPCIDSPDQVCIWKFSFACDATHTAIVSGELIDVELTEDARQKIYHYRQMVPTAAPNIGWVVGQFTPHAHQEMAETTSFALPGLLNLVKHTTSQIDKIMECYEELLSCRYPYSSLKLVFVDQCSESVVAYSSLSILSVHTLYHKKVIDAAQESRFTVAHAIALQFFGCFLCPAHWVDLWCVRSIARFLAALYLEKVFGTSEFLYHTKLLLNEVVNYEFQWGQIILRPDLRSLRKTDFHFDPRHPLMASSLYIDMLIKKGHLVQRMLYSRFGQELYLQVLNGMLSVGVQMADRRERPAAWSYLIVSTEGFFRTVGMVTGQDIPAFVEQWVYNGGHPHLDIAYTFNRRKNIVELTIKQDTASSHGRCCYTGPLTVWIQEIDGATKHTIQVDSNTCKQDLQCHSKGRRQKKKKCPLASGEEVEIDLSNADPESPVLWIRVDPELNVIRSLSVHQPHFQWEYMLKHERDVVSQLQALNRLEQFPSPQSKQALIETITNEMIYYRIRCRAAFTLTRVLNKMTETWCGVPDLIQLFRAKFGCKSNPVIPQQNNFVVTNTTLQQYFLMQAIPQAVSKMKRQGGSTPIEVTQFIVSLIKFNDNSVNRYSDDHYRASLLHALLFTLTERELMNDNSRPDQIASDARDALEEFSYALNMDILKPSYNRVVAIAALTGLNQLQCQNHIPWDSSVFWRFAKAGQSTPVRKAALWILVQRLPNCREISIIDDFNRLLTMAEEDPEPSIRVHIPTLLVATPPFTADNFLDFSYPLNNAQYAEKIWRIITNIETEPAVRGLFCDLYFTSFGYAMPPSLRPIGAPIAMQRKGNPRFFTPTHQKSAREYWNIVDECPPSPSCINYISRVGNMSDDLLQ